MFISARPSTSRLVSSAFKRGVSSSQAALAAAKGKPAKSSAAPPKKAQGGFAKKARDPSGARPGGGGGGGGNASITLRYAEARPSADLGDWPRLQPEVVASSSVGTPVTFSPDTISAIKKFGLPRRLDKELLDASGAACVIRQCTHDLAKRLDTVRQGSSADASGLILTGERGTGKSMLLLQTVAHALNSGWITLYIPRCSSWIDSTTAYAYHAPSQTFHQPALASSILSTLLSVNGDRLQGLTTKSDRQIEAETVSQGTKVTDLINLGLRIDAPGAAMPVLEAVLAELSAQTEVPFLIALDEAQALFSRSKYLTPHAGPVESYDLSVPRLFLSYLNPSAMGGAGVGALPSGEPTCTGGRTQIIAALSYSTPSLPPSFTLLHALDQSTGKTDITPYTPFERPHLRHAAGIPTYTIKELGAKEAGGMFQVYARKGWGAQGDEPFLSSLLASGGNALEFARGLSRSLALA